MSLFVGFCSNCSFKCQGHVVDFGVGPTEFWGVNAVDKDLQYVSKCCDSEISVDPLMNYEAGKPQKEVILEELQMLLLDHANIETKRVNHNSEDNDGYYEILKESDKIENQIIGFFEDLLNIVYDENEPQAF